MSSQLRHEALAEVLLYRLCLVISCEIANVVRIATIWIFLTSKRSKDPRMAHNRHRKPRTVFICENIRCQAVNEARVHFEKYRWKIFWMPKTSCVEKAFHVLYDTFAIICDGSRCGKTHSVATFETFPVQLLLDTIPFYWPSHRWKMKMILRLKQL